MFSTRNQHLGGHDPLICRSKRRGGFYTEWEGGSHQSLSSRFSRLNKADHKHGRSGFCRSINVLIYSATNVNLLSASIAVSACSCQPPPALLLALSPIHSLYCLRFSLLLRFVQLIVSRSPPPPPLPCILHRYCTFLHCITLSLVLFHCLFFSSLSARGSSSDITSPTVTMVSRGRDHNNCLDEQTHLVLFYNTHK